IVAEKDEGIKAALSKMRGYVAKFALICHVVDHVDMRGIDNRGVTLDSVQRAIGLVDWFAHEARRIYRMRTKMTSRADQNRQDLLAFIRRNGGQVTSREVVRQISRFGNTTAAKAELATLPHNGWGGRGLRERK